jgi:hypothetical protein
MDEPRDDVDIWLSERVKPLLPHPGAFERIRRRARRRKLGQAAIAAGGAAVVVAAALTVPPLINAQLRGNSGPPPAASQTPTHPSRSPSASPSATRSTSPASNITRPPAVPGNFAVSSVTFVSLTEGWVIGQAGTPGQCGPPNAFICTSRAITFNGGATWQGGHAPVAGLPKGASGVSQIRALDGRNAWAFGPQLYATHDAGYSWTPVSTNGMRVIDLETVHHHAFAVWARCTGTGADFAANCTSFSLFSTPAGRDQWAPVPGATNLSVSQAAGLAPVPASAQLALTNTVGYLLAPNGEVYSGPTTTGGAWHPATAQGIPAGCLPGRAERDGVPSRAMLATTGMGIVELCAAPGAGGAQVKTLRYSADGGRTWQPAGTAPLAGIATSLSGTPNGRVLVATTTGIDVSANAAGSGAAGLSWITVTGASVPGGFTFVGMTDDTQGVAIPADKALHAVWFTYDGGTTWRQSPVRS